MKNHENFTESDNEWGTERELSRTNVVQLGQKVLAAASRENQNTSGIQDEASEVAMKEKADRNVPKRTPEQEKLFQLKMLERSWREFADDSLKDYPKWAEMQALAEHCRKLSEESEKDYYSFLERTAYDLYDTRGLTISDTYDLVWRYNTLQKYGAFPPETNFYFSTDFETVLNMLGDRVMSTTGARGLRVPTSIVETDPGTGIEFYHEDKVTLSFDTFSENGEMISGLDKDRGARSDEVTLVLDGELTERTAIDTLGKYPTINELDLSASGLALVCKDEETAARMRKYMAEISIDEIHLPVYTREEWLAMGSQANEKASVEHKRIRDEIWQAKLERAEQEALRQEELKRQVLTEVDLADVRETVDQYVEKLDPHRMSEIYWLCSRDLEVGEKVALEYFSEIFELENIPKLEYYSDETDERTAYYSHQYASRPSMIYINTSARRRGRGHPGNIDWWLGTMAHEVWHGHQHTGADSGSSERSEMYQYNFQNYISPEKDFDGYESQLIERESQEMDRRVRAMLARQNEEYNRELRKAAIDDVDQELMASEVRSGLDEIKIGDLLSATGTKTIDELYQKLKSDPKKVIPECIDGLCKLINLERKPAIEFNEGESIELGFQRHNGVICIDPAEFAEGTPQSMLYDLAYFSWFLRDYAISKDNDNPRGEIYDYFFTRREELLNETDRNQQVVVAESRLFARDLMGILEEQRARSRDGSLKTNLKRLLKKPANEPLSYMRKYNVRPLPKNFQPTILEEEYSPSSREGEE